MEWLKRTRGIRNTNVNLHTEPRRGYTTHRSPSRGKHMSPHENPAIKSTDFEFRHDAHTPVPQSQVLNVKLSTMILYQKLQWMQKH